MTKCYLFKNDILIRFFFKVSKSPYHRIFSEPTFELSSYIKNTTIIIFTYFCCEYSFNADLGSTKIITTKNVYEYVVFDVHLSKFIFFGLLCYPLFLSAKKIVFWLWQKFNLIMTERGRFAPEQKTQLLN